MAEKPDPRSVRRLQSLEADLARLRQSSEAVVAERNELKRRVTELEAALEKAQASEQALQQERDQGMAEFEKLVEAGLMTRPRQRSLPAFVQAVARRLADLQARLGKEEAKSARLASQLEELRAAQAGGEEALRDALARLAALQEQIDTRVAEGEKRSKELEAALAEALQKAEMLESTEQGTIAALIAENRRLADQLANLDKDAAVLRGAAEEARAGLEAARQEAAASVRAELEGQLKRVHAERDALQSQLTIANKQLAEQGKTPLLPAEQAAVLVNELVDRLQVGFTDLRITEGELKLKVGFGAVGDVSGFVVPTTDSPAEIRENLQEIAFRFDRTAKPAP